MKCPGQDTQYWQPGAIFEVDCPKCGRSVEFFKDDTSRKCEKCGHVFFLDPTAYGDYQDRCPECGYSKAEQRHQAR